MEKIVKWLFYIFIGAVSIGIIAFFAVMIYSIVRNAMG